MKKLLKINGISHNEIAHSMPLTSIQELEEKQPRQETMIEKSLKAMIKERMSGVLINNRRKNRYLQELNPENEEIISINMEHQRKMRTYLNEQIKLKLHTPTPTKKELHELRRTFDINNNKERDENREQSSFISAIQEEQIKYQSSQKRKVSYRSHMASPQYSKNHDKQFHLPDLKDKNKKQRKDIKKLPSKNLFKKPQDNVNVQTWQIFCAKKKGKEKKNRKNSYLESSSAMALTYDSKAKANTKKSKEAVSKEQILLFLNQLPCGLRILMETFLSFFEVKFPTQLDVRSYGEMLQQVKQIQTRGWSAFGFYFWDAGSDGLLTSEDMFDRFKQFCLGQNEDILPSIAELPHIRQANEKLHSQMNKLNKYFPKKNYQQETEIEEQSQEIKYLQQAVLGKKEVKYSQMVNLLLSGEESEKKPQMSLLPKQLSIKSSSSYRQCFIATQHNEETRLSREQIENCKNQLKKIKQARNQRVRNFSANNRKPPKYITYQKFTEESFWLDIKKIIFSVLGII